MKKAAVTLLAIFPPLLFNSCAPFERSAAKPPEVFWQELAAATTEVEEYLTYHTPADTRPERLSAAVGAKAARFAHVANETRPLRVKKGAAEYGRLTALAEDGVAVTGNLAGALAVDYARFPWKKRELKTAVEDWAAFGNRLAAEAPLAVNFQPRPWWEKPAWREFLAPVAEIER